MRGVKPLDAFANVATERDMTPITAALLTLLAGFTVLLACKGLKMLLVWATRDLLWFWSD